MSSGFWFWTKHVFVSHQGSDGIESSVPFCSGTTQYWSGRGRRKNIGPQERSFSRSLQPARERAPSDRWGWSCRGVANWVRLVLMVWSASWFQFVRTAGAAASSTETEGHRPTTSATASSTSPKSKTCLHRSAPVHTHHILDPADLS